MLNAKVIFKSIKVQMKYVNEISRRTWVNAFSSSSVLGMTRTCMIHCVPSDCITALFERLVTHTQVVIGWLRGWGFRY